MWNKNERDGKVAQAKGRVKQVVATVTKDGRLKAEGEADEAEGKVQATVGRVGRKVGEAIERIGTKVKQ